MQAETPYNLHANLLKRPLLWLVFVLFFVSGSVLPQPLYAQQIPEPTSSPLNISNPSGSSRNVGLQNQTTTPTRLLLGAGTLLLFPSRVSETHTLYPTVQVEVERVRLSTDTYEIRTFFAMGMFNWQTYRDINRCLFNDANSLVALVSIAAIPIIYVFPAFSPWVSHMSTGINVVAHSGHSYPRLFAGGGAGISLFRRPSDAVFFLSPNLNLAAGIHLSERFGFNLRATWDPPIAPGLLSDKRNHALQFSMSLITRLLN